MAIVWDLPPSKIIFFDSLGIALEIYSGKYDKFLLKTNSMPAMTVMGEPDIDTFLQDYGAKNIVKD